MKKIVSLLLSLTLIVTLLPISQASAGDDITGITLEKEMRDVIERGIMKGYGNGIYAPGEAVTRGQFANLIARALDLPVGKQAFNDVGTDSALAPGIYAASEADIIYGYSNTEFRPNQPITREQVALMMSRALAYLQVTMVQGSITFTDASSIGNEARLAVSYMVSLGIINGFPDGNGYAFKGQKTATRAEAAALIYRMLDIYESQQKEGSYTIGTVDASGNITAGSRSYETYAEALKAYTNSATQVILYHDDVIQMGSGMAVSDPDGKATAVLYESNMSTVYASVPAGVELEYVSSDDSKITVKLAGKVAYVKQEDTLLIPKAALKGHSYYYMNASGDLVYSIYNPLKNTYASATVGKAPSSFQQNVKYYSWDGATFMNESGTAIGTYYQYFNMLPFRTKSNYTAEELESIIMTKLAEKEALYTDKPTTYAKYKDATTKSKLIGLGAALKEAEEKYKLNALLVLALAIHESDYGMSAHAQNNNNLFGLAVYDSNPELGAGFASVSDSIEALSDRYLNKNYIPLSGAYANGGMFGNKARGINVRYASDAYWGQKAAGHAYQLDKAMGSKDFGMYAIYETTATSLNARSTPAVSGANLLYAYKKAGYPVAVLETSDGWHKIYSDSTDDLFAYVSASYTSLLNIAK
ncbi:MAG: S-layer homology domain-containing protein [Bacillus sp. (in: firmicutes)]